MEDTTNFNVQKVEILEFISDHKPVACILNIQKPSLPRCKKEYHKLTTKAINDIPNYYNVQILNDEFEANQMVQKFETELTRVLDEVAPLKSKIVHQRPKQLWYTQQL